MNRLITGLFIAILAFVPATHGMLQPEFRDGSACSIVSSAPDSAGCSSVSLALSCRNNPIDLVDPLGLDWFPENFKVENGIPMVELVEYKWRVGLFGSTPVRQKGPKSAVWAPAVAGALEYFEYIVKPCDGGWRVKDARERHAVAVAHASRDLGPAYEQFFKLQEAQAVMFMALPAAAEGASAYLVELTWNAAGLPNPKQVWSMGKAGITVLNPKNWTFASDRLFSGIPIPKFTGAARAAETVVPAAESGASNRALHEQYLDQLRRQMSKPHTTSPELTNLMDDLYRPGAKVGSGSTADAVRHELTTGELVGGRTHITKAQEYAAALQDWLKANPTASGADRAAAENVLRDLSNALGGN